MFVNRVSPKVELQAVLPAAISDEMYTVVELLMEKEVDFFVGGMTAVNCYFDFIRASGDLDLFIVGDTNLPSIRNWLSSIGYDVKLKRRAQFLPVFPKGLEKDDPRRKSFVDIFPSGSFHEVFGDNSLSKSVPIKFKDLDLHGLSTEEILLGKISRGEDRDREDIKQIFTRLGEIGVTFDWDYVEEKAKEWGKKRLKDNLKEIHDSL